MINYMKKKLIIGAVVIGLVALLLGHVIWPPHPGGPTPSVIQIALLLILDAVQSLLFGLGVALLIWGWPLFKNLPLQKAPAKTWTFISVVWLLVSWWPHIGFHVSAGEDLWSIIGIDYAFHFTVIAASLIVIRTLVVLATPIKPTLPWKN